MPNKYHSDDLPFLPASFVSPFALLGVLLQGPSCDVDVEEHFLICSEANPFGKRNQYGKILSKKQSIIAVVGPVAVLAIVGVIALKVIRHSGPEIRDEKGAKPSSVVENGMSNVIDRVREVER